jgi:hypothetical protein
MTTDTKRRFKSTKFIGMLIGVGFAITGICLDTANFERIFTLLIPLIIAYMGADAIMNRNRPAIIQEPEPEKPRNVDITDLEEL